MPQLVLPIAFVSYDYKEVTHDLSLMPKAPGRSILSYVYKFLKSPTDSNIRNFIKQCHYDIGKAMANFYKTYAASNDGLPIGIVHGDLHVGNIFYDAESRQVALIDNSNIASSLRRARNCRGDIYHLLRGWIHALPPSLQGAWVNLSVSSFFHGFMDTYPEAEQKAVHKELKACISKKSNIYDEAKNAVRFMLLADYEY